jgi:hypothetical protein
MRAWRQIGSPAHIARSTPLNLATRTQVLRRQTQLEDLARRLREAGSAGKIALVSG